MRRILVTFLTLLLLWVVVGEVNHALSGVHVYLFVGGLFVTYAALQLPLRHGLAAVMLIGLLADAHAPVRFGLQSLLFAISYVIIFNIRDHVPREETVARVFVALLTNLGVFLVFSFALIGRSPSPGAIWPRLFFDLLCSQVFLTLIAPWFFALQARALILANVERDSIA